MFIVSILQAPPLSIALCEWYRNAGIVASGKGVVCLFVWTYNAVSIL